MGRVLGLLLCLGFFLCVCVCFLLFFFFFGGGAGGVINCTKTRKNAPSLLAYTMNGPSADEGSGQTFGVNLHIKMYLCFMSVTLFY